MKARLSARTVLGIAILASCSTTGNPGGSDVQDYVPTGAPDTPPPDYDPPPGQDPPPSDFDDPSGPGSTTGGNRCNEICPAVIAEGCDDYGEDIEACTVACDDYLDEAAPCDGELHAFLECAIRSPDFNCDVLTGQGDGQGQFMECQSQAAAYVACLDDNGGGEGGQGGI